MLLCGVAFGQSLFVGIKVGGASNTTPFRMPGKVYLGDVSGRISQLCGFKAGADLKHVQAGVGVDLAAYSYTIKTGTQTGVVSMPYTYPHGFANYKKNMGTVSLYGGVNAGYYIAGQTTTWNRDDRNGTKVKGGKVTNGVSGGVQIGVSCRVTRGLQLHGEAGARYLPIKTGGTYYDAFGNPIGQTENKPVFTVPVSIGVTYRISSK